jgi:hypothetical protein
VLDKEQNLVEQIQATTGESKMMMGKPATAGSEPKVSHTSQVTTP